MTIDVSQLLQFGLLLVAVMVAYFKQRDRADQRHEEVLERISSIERSIAGHEAQVSNLHDWVTKVEMRVNHLANGASTRK